MGAGKNKAHQSFPISPTAKAGPAQPAEGPSLAPSATPGPGMAAVLALPGAPAPEGDLGTQYTDFCGQVAHAQSLIGGAGDHAPGAVGEANQHLKAATSAWLGSLDESQLQGLAAGAGFEHPTLVGLNSKPGEPGALAHWLDPAYPPHAMSKAKVQAKALERYDELPPHPSQRDGWPHRPNWTSCRPIYTSGPTPPT